MTASRYASVDVVERVRLLAISHSVDELDEFTYSWSHGYETLTTKREGGGGFEYRGSYHPHDGCCTGRGVCDWCGRTLHDA